MNVNVNVNVFVPVNLAVHVHVLASTRTRRAGYHDTAFAYGNTGASSTETTFRSLAATVTSRYRLK